jgi:HEAT repeat protein
VDRTAAARVIGRLKLPSAGDALIRAVNDSNAGVRHASMVALGEVKELRAIESLTDQLNYYGKGEGAWAALHALALIAHPSSVPTFKARIADKDELLRRAAMEGLGRAGDRSEIVALEVAANNDSSAVGRAAAAFALQRLGRNMVARMVEFMASEKTAPQVAGYLLELGPAVIQPLTPHLLDQEPAIRANVAQVMGALGGPAALAALEPLRTDRDRTVAQAAERAIARAKMGK